MKQVKLKICSNCEKEFPRLWKAKTREHGAMCKDCWMAYQAGEGNIDNSKKKAPKRIKAISDKRAKELVEYRKLRDEFLKENNFCERCGSKHNLELHHLAGREGSRLTDVDNFMTLCRSCHVIVTEHTAQAIEEGYAKSRLSKD